MDDTRKADKVIFISHQWTSFNHPDPKNEQLKALQMTIRNLLSGKTTVRTNWALEMGYGIKKVIYGVLSPPDPTQTPTQSKPKPKAQRVDRFEPDSYAVPDQITGQKEWKELLDDGYIWFDYLSIPQPLAAKQKKEESEVNPSPSPNPNPKVEIDGCNSPCPSALALNPIVNVANPNAPNPKPGGGRRGHQGRGARRDEPGREPPRHARGRPPPGGLPLP